MKASPVASPSPLSWPPAETWLAPPLAAQPAPISTAGWPTPTPALPPSGAGHPSSSPYSPVARGYDASWPQCSAGTQPQHAAFGIVGVNGGRAFTLNPCFLKLLSAAPKDAEIYLNTGFYPGNSIRLRTDCQQRAAALPGATPDEVLGYALGCSTTQDTLDVLREFAVPAPPTWWLDVEETNSWDDGHPEVNRYEIEGQIDALAPTGGKIGIYSTFPDWRQVTGGAWGDPRIGGDWVAGKSPQEACSSPGFSGAPVWLAQELATWAGSGYDSDYAC